MDDDSPRRIVPLADKKRKEKTKIIYFAVIISIASRFSTPRAAPLAYLFV